MRRRLPGLLPSVLVPNLKGAERAIDVAAHALLLPLSASHAHSLANLRKTPDEVVAEIGRIVDLRDAKGSACLVEVGISTAFGCTIQGRVEPAEVLRLVRAVLDAGADRVGLADTVGYADPLQVKALFEQALAVAGDKLCVRSLPRHARPGLGQRVRRLAERHAPLRRLPGGIGGCPHAPGASGNVATEDVAYLFASMGVPTGLDFKALIALRAQVAQWLDGEPLHGAIWRAGLPRTLA